jgi:Domain of Unknown Function (DUF326)
MHHVSQMLETHPQATPTEVLARCIEECFACAMTCTSCADACLAEEDVQELVRCIRLNLDCADVCEATGRMLTRQTSPEPRLALSMLETCAQACRLCAEECERHAGHHEHCRICAEACRRCEQACKVMRSSINA